MKSKHINYFISVTKENILQPYLPTKRMVDPRDARLQCAFAFAPRFVERLADQRDQVLDDRALSGLDLGLRRHARLDPVAQRMRRRIVRPAGKRALGGVDSPG